MTQDLWRTRPQQQQVDWPDAATAKEQIELLQKQPPLVFAGEVRQLRERLAGVSRGEATALIAGDCAESFDLLNANRIRDQLKIILQMALVITHGSGRPVVKLGRMAGQFAKPRSSALESGPGGTIPTFRGHLINSEFADEMSRTPDPRRLIRGYNYSASMLNLIRAFVAGGMASLDQIHAWNQDFVAASPAGARYEATAQDIDRALRFLKACGADGGARTFSSEFYTAHEGLVLDYESALTRLDSFTNTWYACSAHLLWIGERTRQLDGAHVEYMRGIANPVGVKVSDKCDPEELLLLCKTLDPRKEPGKLVLMSRMGAARIKDTLPPLLEATKKSGHQVVWMTDPMHGNTRTTATGLKTRDFEDVASETLEFIDIAKGHDVHPGGFHFELTPEDVTECTGGSWATTERDLTKNYTSLCDPRLNGSQGLDLAYLIAENIRRD